MVEESKIWIEYLAVAIEIATAGVIGMAALEAVAHVAPLFLRRSAPQSAKVDLRLALGRWLAVGLELALAADILRTAIAPSWNEIGQLAAVAALRTALNYFLAKEIEREEERRKAVRAGAA